MFPSFTETFREPELGHIPRKSLQVAVQNKNQVGLDLILKEIKNS